jgi:uncharacterized membrane protein HdeD (DUF308 family)
MENARLKVLKMVETGQIDVQEATMLLAALEEAEAPDRPEASSETLAQATGPAQESGQRRENRWASLWIYPLMAGGVVLILGSLVIGLVYATGAALGWLVCGWLPMLSGLMIVFLALWSRQASWMHLRISEGGRRKMALSFPLPLTLVAWAVRIAEPFIPQLQKTGVDDLIVALRASGSRGEPIFIDVQDDEEGERVELYIG